MYIFKLLISTYYYIKASFAISKYEYAQALYFFNKIDPKVARKSYIYYYERGFLHFMLGLTANAKLDCAKSIELIDKSKKLNNDERNYLKKINLHILCLIHSYTSKVADTTCYTEYNNIHYNKDNISRLLRNLPNLLDIGNKKV